MAETKKAEEGGKKGKGKLPIIIAVLVVLAAGGYFFMKPGAKQEEAHIEPGHTESLGAEFLVNLKDGYLKTSVSCQLIHGAAIAEAGGHGGAAPEDAEVRDAVIRILREKSVRSFEGEGIREVKREIAYAINQILVGRMKDPEKKDAAKRLADDHKAHAASADPHKEPAAEDSEEEEHHTPKDWDSGSGPVIKVLFANFVTQ